MKLTVYSHRWGHNDSYEVEITSSGWKISHISIGGDCDPTGEPYLYGNLNQDFISYPNELGDYMEKLWSKATKNNWSEARIQAGLDDIGEWVQATEKSAPSGDIWD